MNDERLREAYERGLPPNDGLPTLDDVAAERLRRLVEGEGSENERLRTLDVALSTAEGRRELEIAWAAARAARPRQVVWRRSAIAASLLLAAGVSSIWWWQQEASVGEALRSGESPVTLIAPLGEVESRSGTRFVWRPVRDAERYTLVLVDTTGAEVYASETLDTSLALPDSIRLAPARSYLWWVQARRADQSTVTAVTQRILVRSP